jgi:ketosteroid isomerase-like protein
MAGELESVLRAVFTAIDAEDLDALVQLVADDMEGVDEISRRWLRGGEANLVHHRDGLGAIANVRSTLRDVHESVDGELGVVTCWLEQDYTYEETPTHISGPCTLIFRRESGRWKIRLFHAVPLPPE